MEVNLKKRKWKHFVALIRSNFSMEQQDSDDTSGMVKLYIQRKHWEPWWWAHVVSKFPNGASIQCKHPSSWALLIIVLSTWHHMKQCFTWRPKGKYYNMILKKAQESRKEKKFKKHRKATIPKWSNSLK